MAFWWDYQSSLLTIFVVHDVHALRSLTFKSFYPIIFDTESQYIRSLAVRMFVDNSLVDRFLYLLCFFIKVMCYVISTLFIYAIEMLSHSIFDSSFFLAYIFHFANFAFYTIDQV